MKKEVILIAILMIGLCAGQPVLNLDKQNYQPYETITGKIRVEDGSFSKSIEKSEIKFFEGKRQVYFDFDIAPYNNSYFFYAYIQREGNFTIRVENILYKQGDELKSESIESGVGLKNNFKENNTDLQILSIKPGFVFSSKPEATLKNMGTKSINFTYEIGNISGSEFIAFGESKKISFYPEKEFSYFSVSGYEKFLIPVIYLGRTNMTPVAQNNTNATLPEEFNLLVEPRNISIKIRENESIKERVILINPGSGEIRINSLINNLRFIELEEINKIAPNSSQEFKVSINPEQTGVFLDEIIVNYSGSDKSASKIIKIPVQIYILSGDSINDGSQGNIKSCSELGGKLCEYGQGCEGRAEYASGGLCCIGTCNEIKINTGGDSYTNIIIAIILIIAVGVGGFIVYKKIKKIKPKTPGEEIEEKSKTYEKRIIGGLSRT